MTDETQKAAPVQGTTELPGIGLTPKFSTWLYANVNGDLTRLFFGDFVPGNAKPQFHTSIVTSTENAISFANLILRLVKQDKETRAKETEVEAKPPEQSD